MPAPNSDAVAYRRKRLRDWLDLHFGGKQSAFVAATGVNQGELSGLLNTKSFGESRARSLEIQAGMPTGYLDAIDGAIGKSYEQEIADLRRQIESMSIVLAGLVDVGAKHRPLEGDELYRMIRENQSLTPGRREILDGLLGSSDQKDSKLTKVIKPARKRTGS